MSNEPLTLTEGHLRVIRHCDFSYADFDRVRWPSQSDMDTYGDELIEAGYMYVRSDSEWAGCWDATAQGHAAVVAAGF